MQRKRQCIRETSSSPKEVSNALNVLNKWRSVHFAAWLHYAWLPFCLAFQLDFQLGKNMVMCLLGSLELTKHHWAISLQFKNNQTMYSSNVEKNCLWLSKNSKIIEDGGGNKGFVLSLLFQIKWNNFILHLSHWVKRHGNYWKRQYNYVNKCSFIVPESPLLFIVTQINWRNRYINQQQKHYQH